MEVVLVLWGAGGRGKTQSARCVAKHLAVGHDTLRYISTGNVEALKIVQKEFDERDPVILEELSADDVSQHGRGLSANYLKNLFDVPDGGACRVRNTCVLFHPRQPRILCINDKPQDWLQRIQGLKDSDQLPLERRLFFVEADEMLIVPEAVAKHEAELDDVRFQKKEARVQQNSRLRKQRRRRHYARARINHGQRRQPQHAR